MVALLTLGEGYHSFHHRFPADFRNGIRWYQWDPAKWWIRALRSVGLAQELIATPDPQIEQARMSAALRLVENQIAAAPPTLGDEVRKKIADAITHLETAFALWRQHAEEKAEGMSNSWRETRRHARQRVREARREWKTAVRMVARIPAAA
jgi:stearoyl-CoA desaturase (delta-9 desaturase)